MKTDKWCENCRWWGSERAHRNDMPVGTCRVLPPQLGEVEVLAYHDPQRPEVVGPMVRRAVWPWTAMDDWCASFTAKPPTDEDSF